MKILHSYGRFSSLFSLLYTDKSKFVDISLSSFLICHRSKDAEQYGKAGKCRIVSP